MNRCPLRRRFVFFSSAILASITPLNPGFAKVSLAQRPAVTAPLSYADLADIFAAAPLVLKARITSAVRIKDATTPPAIARFYVEAGANALIRGPEDVPARVRYLVDLTPDSRGKLLRLKKADVLLAAQPVPGRPGSLQLVAPDAQRFWTAQLETRVRALIASVVAPDAPPPITGISSAFHVPGTVIGEGETQIFLNTATGAPVSLTVLRRVGEAPRWAFALGEIVDEAAAVPQRDTLAWYRLACFLPATLPAAATTDLSADDAEAARGDYAIVIDALGTCTRQRG